MKMKTNKAQKISGTKVKRGPWTWRPDRVVTLYMRDK